MMSIDCSYKDMSKKATPNRLIISCQPELTIVFTCFLHLLNVEIPDLQHIFTTFFNNFSTFFVIL